MDKNIGSIQWNNAAKVSIVTLNIFLILQFVNVYQASYQLDTPLVPKNIIWEVNKQYIFTAAILSAANLFALLLFFWRKNHLVVILVTIALIGTGFTYI